MLRTSFLFASLCSVAFFASALFVGCHKHRGCQSGTCPAPTYAPSGNPAPIYSDPGFQGSGTIHQPPQHAPPPSYEAPAGSGTRSQPSYGGSGTR